MLEKNYHSEFLLFYLRLSRTFTPAPTGPATLMTRKKVLQVPVLLFTPLYSSLLLFTPLSNIKNVNIL